MEIMIVNIMTARMRSLSDPVLDNSLACLHGDLRARGIEAKIVDGCTIDLYAKFTVKPINHFFQRICQKMMNSLGSGKRPTYTTMGASFLLDLLLRKYQDWAMERWLRQVAREVAKHHVPFLGIKTWYGEAYGWAKRLVQLVNKYSPETITICGGPQANIYHAEGAVLKYSNFDLAVYSVGKGVLAEIIEVARSGQTKTEKIELIKKAKIDNLIYREKDGEIRINPLRKTELVEGVLPRYTQQKGKLLMHNLVEGLGCPWNQCNFCPHKNITPHYQGRRIEEIIVEIKAVLTQGIGVFRFCGSDTPLKVGTRLAEAIINENLSIVFSMFNRAVKNAKANYAEIRDSYRLLIRAGLSAVFMGIETANDVINNEMLNKNLCCEDIIYTMRAIKEAGKLEGRTCDVIMAFIHPVPLVEGITNDQVLAENIELIKIVQPAAVLITPAGVFPQTAWYDEAEKFGFELGENYLYDLMHLEYILTKPPQLWKNAPRIKMNGKNPAEMFKESGQFTNAVHKLNIPVGIGDESMMMYRLVGYSDNEKLLKVHQMHFVELMACSYEHVQEFYQEFNQASRAIALRNFEEGERNNAKFREVG